MYREMHTQALGLELDGQFDFAQEGYRAVLMGLETTFRDPDNAPLDANLLRADTWRDNAMAQLRRGLAHRSDNYDHAQEGLERARAFSEPYLTDTSLTAQQRTRASVTTAMTLTCMGAMISSRQVFRDERPISGPATTQQRPEMRLFEEAHRTAMQGNKSYAGANNAMRAARAEVINRESILMFGKEVPDFAYVTPWLSRAVWFVGHGNSGLADRRDAVRTIFSHSRFLRSQQAARAAAIHWRWV